MKLQFLICSYLFLIIIFNSFQIIICQSEEETNKIEKEKEEEDPFPIINEDECLMITLYNNGSLDRKKVLANSTKEKIITIGSVDKIILYDCLDYNKGECSYRNWTGSQRKEDVFEKRAHNSDFYSCYIFEEYYYNDTNHPNFSGCIEVEKNEYERFRSNIYDINKFKPFNNTRIGKLECFDINYIKTKYIYIYIFIALLLFLF